MVRDTLAIASAVIDHLKRLGGAARAHDTELGDPLRTLGRYTRLSCPEDVLVEVRDGEATTEPTPFVRAFRSWERTTPLRWRAVRS